VDEHAKVVGTSRVWAAGDATSGRLKHSVVATAQADAAATAIAAAAGASVEVEPWEPVLHGILIARPLAPPSSVWVHDDEPLTHCLWWPPARVTGHALAKLIAARDPSARAGLRSHPNGVPVAAPVGAVPDSAVKSAATGGRPDELAANALTRELQALRRLERDSLRRSAAAGDDAERFERAPRGCRLSPAREIGVRANPPEGVGASRANRLGDAGFHRGAQARQVTTGALG